MLGRCACRLLGRGQRHSIQCAGHSAVVEEALLQDLRFKIQENFIYPQLPTRAIKGKARRADIQTMTNMTKNR